MTMGPMTAGTKSKGKPTDESALLLLLAYVEAECRRIGAFEAAGHAALAASSVEQGKNTLCRPTRLSDVCH